MEHGEREAMKKQELVEKIVKAEWEAFDKVQNEGGRASCQNDWNTFSIMRKSQYMTWPEELLAMFLEYFTACYEQGRNLITEKYGRMEESTAPEAYAKIKDAFPALSEERIFNRPISTEKFTFRPKAISLNVFEKANRGF